VLPRATGRKIQRHIFLDAHFLDIRAIFSGRETKIEFICDAQFLQVRAIVSICLARRLS
jgi:hypothetical protein